MVASGALADPVLTVLAASAAAAVCSALGATPYLLRREPGTAWIASSNALAGGCMLGIGYLLMQLALSTPGGSAGGTGALLGAGLGIAYTRLCQLYADTDANTDDVADDEAPDDAAPDAPGSGREVGYKVLLQGTLHSASEGLAIGLALSMDPRLGLFLVAALALHNIGEGLVLVATLRDQGVAVHHGAGLAVTTKASQVLLAIVAVAVLPAHPSLLAPALGFAAGSLLFLVLAEIAPAAYREGRNQTVAVLLTLSAALVVFLEHLLA